MTATLLASLEAAHRALSECEASGSLQSISDELLISALERAAAVRRLVDARSAMLAGEIAQRSTPQLAHAGLAQRHGHRTPEELVRVATGSSRHDARVAVRAGVILAGLSEAGAGAAGAGVDDSGAEDSTRHPGSPLWAHILIEPVMRGELSTAALEAIRSGLGDVGDTVSHDDLSAAARTLLAEAATLDVDRLYRRARQLRDELDTAGIAERERTRRNARSLRLFRGNDGMTRATWLLDPESAAIVTDLYDRATSPRRGGPTFFSGGDAALVERMRADERTPEQYASDAFLDLLRTGADADSSALLSSGAPSIRVVVTAHDLREDVGYARLDGQVEPLSLPTVQRMICAGTHTPILVCSTGQPLDVGRTQRLFTPRQRVALATRDGGCRWAGCERPPSWTEAHHITPWKEAGGPTDVADGILLCRHHHLLVHNNGWRIERHRGPDGLDQYQAIPPSAGIGAGVRTAEPIALPAHDNTIQRAIQPQRAA